MRIFYGLITYIYIIFRLGDRCEIIKISQPIKSHWAKEKNLNLNEMLSDSEYKEQYRLDMIKWSDEMRDQDYGCFCREACQNGISKSLLLCFDFRMNNLNIFVDFICALNWYYKYRVLQQKTIYIHYLFHEITIEGISEAKILSLILILKKKTL